MLGKAILLAALPSLFGFTDLGWQPAEEGGLEFVIQIEPELLDDLREGRAVVNEIPPDLRGIRRFRIVVGDQPIPRRPQQPGELRKHLDFAATGKTSLQENGSTPSTEMVDPSRPQELVPSQVQVDRQVMPAGGFDKRLFSESPGRPSTVNGRPVDFGPPPQPVQVDPGPRNSVGSTSKPADDAPQDLSSTNGTNASNDLQQADGPEQESLRTPTRLPQPNTPGRQPQPAEEPLEDHPVSSPESSAVLTLAGWKVEDLRGRWFGPLLLVGFGSVGANLFLVLVVWGQRASYRRLLRQMQSEGL